LLSLGVAALAAAGCARTRFETSGRTPEGCLCQGPGEQVSALVLWGTRWRPDQKEVSLREAVVRRVDGRPAIELSPAEVRTFAAAQPSGPSRALFITVRELGPVVKLFSSLAPVEGGTEVVLDIGSTVLATGESLADSQSHWEHGGPWVLKGVATLEQDIGSALQAALGCAPR
jgi:hypothetical protein